MSRTNAFVCIYSNFSPKIGCHGYAPLFLVYGSATDEFHYTTNPIPKPDSASIWCIHLQLCPFLPATLRAAQRAGIHVTQRPIFRFFAPQGRHVAPIGWNMARRRERKTKLCMDVSLTAEVMAIFVTFWPILAKIWLPWQRPLYPCNHKCLIWIGRPLKLYPRTKNFVNSCYRREVMSIRRFVTSLALPE